MSRSRSEPGGGVRRLLVAGALAGPLFVATALLEGARRPGYDPIRHPISTLALGPRGYRQATNFTVAGALYLGLATGLARYRRAAPAPLTSRMLAPAVAVSAVGLLASAALPTDPVSGFPPGTPAATVPPSTTGNLHNLAATPIVFALPAVQLLDAWTASRSGRRGRAAYSVATALVSTAGFFASAAAFAQTPGLVRFGGLLQRTAVVSAFGWESTIAVRALRDLQR